MTFKDFLQEAFKDLGKLSADELKKGQKLVGDDDDFTQVNGRIFHKSISKIKANDLARGDKAKGLDSLTIYSVKEYSQMNCYLGKNNSSGYAVKPNGELVSVFSTQGSSARSLMTSAIENGATNLDCFALRSEQGKISGALYGLYTKFGFKIDTSMNVGIPGEAYSIVKGVSSFVDDNGVVHPDDPRVVIFMKR